MKRLFSLLMALLLVAPLVAQEEPVPFNGLLLGHDGKPARGVRVYVSNPEKYAQTDRKGRFGLTNVKPTDTLHVRYEKCDYLIPVNGKRSMQIRIYNTDKFESEESQSLLDYGMSYVGQREYVGYNSRITGEELMATGCTDIPSALSGMIPGLSVDQDFETGAYRITIRGAAYHENSAPLYIVDEMEQKSIDHIQLNQVAYVVVMKDAAMYGVRGGNGAIVVRTKSAETVRPN
ncbi:MAG: TonB-dependent receptor plug domain-containing protein [Alistipes sp.]|nr:TonB-dependent receptor plug domain-containing protein [Alistipes sp.]